MGRLSYLTCIQRAHHLESKEFSSKFVKTVVFFYFNKFLFNLKVLVDHNLVHIFFRNILFDPI